MSADAPAVVVARRVVADPIYGAAVVAREVENAALTTADRPAADAAATIDARFDAEVNRLRDDLRRREEDLPPYPSVSARDGLEALAFVLAAVGFAIGMVAMSRSIAADVAVWSAVALCGAATALHGLSAWRGRTSGPSRHAGSYRLLSAAGSAAAAAAGFALAAASLGGPLILVGCAAACTVLGVVSVVRWVPVARAIEVRRAAFDSMMSGLEASLAGAADRASGDFDVVLTRLGHRERDRFERDRAAGLAAFARRDDASGIAGFDAAAGPGRLRYHAVRL